MKQKNQKKRSETILRNLLIDSIRCAWLKHSATTFCWPTIAIHSTTSDFSYCIIIIPTRRTRKCHSEDQFRDKTITIARCLIESFSWRRNQSMENGCHGSTNERNRRSIFSGEHNCEYEHRQKRFGQLCSVNTSDWNIDLCCRWVWHRVYKQLHRNQVALFDSRLNWCHCRHTGLSELSSNLFYSIILEHVIVGSNFEHECWLNERQQPVRNLLSRSLV